VRKKKEEEEERRNSMKILSSALLHRATIISGMAKLLFAYQCFEKNNVSAVRGLP